MEIDILWCLSACLFEREERERERVETREKESGGGGGGGGASSYDSAGEGLVFCLLLLLVKCKGAPTLEDGLKMMRLRAFSTLQVNTVSF